MDDVRQLTGCDLIELANGRVTTEDRWDAALSSGHPVWAIGDDDTHDVTDPNRMAFAWNMTDAATSSNRDGIDARRAGRSYTVVRTVEQKTAGDLTLADVHVGDGTVTVMCDGPPATFVFVGQNGAICKTATDVTSASYAFAPGDTYVRTVVHGARTDLFLNPILRTDGGRPRALVAVIDGVWTASARAAIIAACAVVVWLLLWSSFIRRPLQRRRDSHPRTPRLSMTWSRKTRSAIFRSPATCSPSSKRCPRRSSPIGFHPVA